MGYDRDEVLARTDLVQLAADICGPPSGHGRSARWHCPNPDHPDTHPSMTVYQAPRSQRWKCHACGEGGTAIDLWMLSQRSTVAEAITALGERCGATSTTPAPSVGLRLKHLLTEPMATTAPGRPPSEGDSSAFRNPELPPAAAARANVVDPDTFDVRVESYVAAAADMLWTARGEGALRWLRDRGFSDLVLRANRVGYDPGPRGLRRAKGLPWRGVGIVLPILGTRDRAIWAQTRYLDPGGTGRKYDSVVSEIAPNPRVATIRSTDPTRADLVVLTEGIPDGLTVAHTGVQAVAVVGTGNTGPDVAARLHQAFPRATFLVAFDNDTAGRTTGPKLGAHLAELGHTVVATTPAAPHNDLNDWWRADPAGLKSQIDAAARPALYKPATFAAVPTPAL